MHQPAKSLGERINKVLDEAGMPSGLHERYKLLRKQLRIHVTDADAITLRNALDGSSMPNPSLLQRIALELDVDIKQLLDHK